MTPAMTYRALQARLAEFTPAQLDAEIFWWGEERGGTVKSLDILEEDFCDMGNGGCEPVSTSGWR